jgi:hypothetical protein
MRFGWFCKLLIGSALGGGSPHWTISGGRERVVIGVAGNIRVRGLERDSEPFAPPFAAGILENRRISGT